MTTKEKVERLLGIIQELMAFYSEMSDELSENHLRVVVDNTRVNSELKKISRKCLISQFYLRRLMTKKGV